MRQLHLANSIAQHGDDDQALAITNALLAKHPEFVPAIKLQGALLEDMGRGSAAALSYEKALRLAPDDPELLLKVGVYQLIADHNDETISLLRRRLKLVPRDRDALYYLAQAYHLKGENGLALKAIETCVEVDPGNASVWQKYGEILGSAGDNEGALRWLLKAQRSDPTLERVDFDLGVVSYNDMKFLAAVKYALRAAERQPSDPEVFALLAAAQVKLSQWQNAKDTFARVLAIRKDDQTSLLGLGQCEVELKQYQAAIDTLEHLIQVDPTQILAHFYLSRAFAGLGEAAEAQQEADLHNRMMQQLPSGQLDEDGEHEKAIWSQGRQLLIQDRETEARSLFQRSYRGAAATPGGQYVFVGALYLSLGNAEDALRNLDRALEVEPNVPGAHTYMGILALQRGDLSKAEDELEIELAHHPNNRPAIAEMGELRYLQGRWSDAADELAKSRTVNPSLLYMLCDSYFHLGKTKDARLTAEIVAAYGRNDPHVMRALVDMVSRNGDPELAQRLSSNLKH